MDKFIIGLIAGFILCTWALDTSPLSAVQILAEKTTVALNSMEQGG